MSYFLSLRVSSEMYLNSLPLNQHRAWRVQDVQFAAVADDVQPYVRV